VRIGYRLSVDRLLVIGDRWIGDRWIGDRLFKTTD